VAPARATSVLMNRPAKPPDGPARTMLEERVSRLEAQLDALIEAIEVLARGLEGSPMTEPRDTQVEAAARRTHELLLLAKSAPRE